MPSLAFPRPHSSRSAFRLRLHPKPPASHDPVSTVRRDEAGWEPRLPLEKTLRDLPHNWRERLSGRGTTR